MSFVSFVCIGCLPLCQTNIPSDECCSTLLIHARTQPWVTHRVHKIKRCVWLVIVKNTPIPCYTAYTRNPSPNAMLYRIYKKPLLHKYHVIPHIQETLPPHQYHVIPHIQETLPPTNTMLYRIYKKPSPPPIPCYTAYTRNPSPNAMLDRIYKKPLPQCHVRPHIQETPPPIPRYTAYTRNPSPPPIPCYTAYTRNPSPNAMLDRIYKKPLPQCHVRPHIQETPPPMPC